MKITAKDTLALQAQGATVLDVRTVEEYAAGHLPGAINLPLDALMEAPYYAPDHKKPVVVYCASGERSGRAAAVLTAGGWEKVYDMGAISNWKYGLE